MPVTRRDFIRGGVAAFTVSFTAPAFLSDIARAQGARSRSLVVVYLGGGNDALNTVVPYQDQFYYSRRPTIAVPAGQVLQVGSDSSGRALGLHPRLTGLQSIFNEGRLAIIQRTGYQNSSRSHFQGSDIWGTANPSQPNTTGWLGRYLESVPRDALAGWSTTREVPRALTSRELSVPGIGDARSYAFASPNGPAEALNERAAATRIASHLPVELPHLSFVNGTATATFETLDQHQAQMGAISKIERLEPDVLHIVMDYPFPLKDRDYVARFAHRTEADGTEVFAWTPVVHANAPATSDAIRLTWLEGEWRFTPDGNRTRVTYVWQADPGGSIPDVGAVRKQAGTLAIKDMAKACGTSIVGP